MAALGLIDSPSVEILEVRHELKGLLVQDLYSCASHITPKQEVVSQNKNDFMENFNMDFLDEYIGEQDIREVVDALSKQHINTPMATFLKKFQTVCDTFARMGLDNSEIKVLLLCKHLQGVHDHCSSGPVTSTASAIRGIESLSLSDIRICESRLHTLSLESILPPKPNQQTLCDLLSGISMSDSLERSTAV